MRRPDIEAMVLWDPVIRGKAYLDELQALHREFLSAIRGERIRVGPEQHCDELLGFELSDQLRSELIETNLLAAPSAPAKQVLLIQSTEKRDDQDLSAQLASIVPRFDHQYYPGERIKGNFRDGAHLLMSSRAVPAIASWISEVRP
jgi:hypothetical protein